MAFSYGFLSRSLPGRQVAVLNDDDIDCCHGRRFVSWSCVSFFASFDFAYDYTAWYLNVCFCFLFIIILLHVII